MNNRGQTTILFTLMISVLMLFTLSALEVGRIYMSRVKAASVVQSARLSIMADYNRELFERYHLLFMDPTYGTGSEAVLEEKMIDYLETSLKEDKDKIYAFTIEELAISEETHILDDDMKLLKEQIESYEKTVGILHRAKAVCEKVKEKNTDVESAAKETETNGVPLTGTSEESKAGEEESLVEVKDPRETMKEALKLGVFAFLKPADLEIESSELNFQNSPSAIYEQQEEEEGDNSFKDIGVLKNFLKKCSKEKDGDGIIEKAAFLDYIDYHFSNGVHQKEDSVAKCEVEYILKGKDNDLDNIQSVVNEMIWLRMPVNYVYLLTDEVKKSEALTVAVAICTATGTEAFIEVVKYLLLGCWAYGETLCDMRTLLNGGEIAYTKTAVNWKTDLKNLMAVSTQESVTNGMSYEDYLLILLAKRNGKKQDICYARMLDLIELNLKKTDETFAFQNCVGELTIQGKIGVNSLFLTGKDRELYEYYFEKTIQYGN